MTELPNFFSLLFSRYNSADGDYGYVIVTEHIIGGVQIYSLYGHLDQSSVSISPPGRTFAAGEVPFQLSINLKMIFFKFAGPQLLITTIGNRSSWSTA